MQWGALGKTKFLTVNAYFSACLTHNRRSKKIIVIHFYLFQFYLELIVYIQVMDLSNSDLGRIDTYLRTSEAGSCNSMHLMYRKHDSDRQSTYGVLRTPQIAITYLTSHLAHEASHQPAVICDPLVAISNCNYNRSF